MKAIEHDMIFDLGADAGDDTAYYLHKGYRVVAVEPNPHSVSRLRERFSAEINSGRLTLVDAAISTSEGTAPFWICDDAHAWSSLDRGMASKNDSRHSCVSVPTQSFASLLDRFGVPFYCKIDIEGSDKICLDDMRPSAKPPFISVEMMYKDSRLALDPTRALLDRLLDLGYQRFKVISQVTHRQPAGTFLRFKAMLPRSASIRVTRVEGMLLRYRPEEDWPFDGHVSGPFGEETDGNWLEASEARDLIQILHRNPDISDWFDIHAAE
jgi:FkbM family methyltransferase